MAGKDAETESQDKPEKKKKSLLFKIIILVVLLAILGGGGFFGYVKFLKKEPPAQAAEPQIEQSVAVDMGTFLVNLSDPGGKRYLKITMQFELSGQKLNEEVTKRNVELRDMIIMLLSSKEYSEIGNATGKITLKRELVSRLNKMLREGQVKEVYFTEFLVQ